MAGGVIQKQIVLSRKLEEPRPPTNRDVALCSIVRAEILRKATRAAATTTSPTSTPCLPRLHTIGIPAHPQRLTGEPALSLAGPKRSLLAFVQADDRNSRVSRTSCRFIGPVACLHRSAILAHCAWLGVEFTSRSGSASHKLL